MLKGERGGGGGGGKEKKQRTTVLLTINNFFELRDLSKVISDTIVRCALRKVMHHYYLRESQGEELFIFPFVRKLFESACLYKCK